MPYPDYNFRGHLPPFTGYDESPYIVNIAEVVERFVEDRNRLKLLKGLMDYRQDLHDAGFKIVSQWIDGPFVDKSAEPDCIHVASLCVDVPVSPEGIRHLLDPQQCERRYLVRPRLLDLCSSGHLISRLTAEVTQHFSHSAEHHWKGFLEVPFLNGDAEATSRLEELLDE